MDFSPRKAAAEALSAILYDGAYSTLYIDQVLKKLPRDTQERDKRFFTGLVYTTLSHLPSLDYKLKHWSKMPLKKLPHFVLCTLRVALSQILFMDKVPENAAVSEAVNLVKKSSFRNLASFTNAVLRTGGREGYTVPMPNREKEKALFFSVTYDMPLDIVEDYLKSYDDVTAEKILSLSCGEKPLSVRINALKASEEEILKRLQSDPDVSELVQGLEGSGVYYLKYNGSFASWSLYREGLLYAQDESSVLAALAACAKPGMKVLDLCAAPGGKTAVIAQCMNNRGEIVSRDLHPARVELIKENMKRLGITCVDARTSDGTDSESVAPEFYDIVVLDAPCSGLGVVRGKPDIKYHRADNDATLLKEVQEKLLNTAARALKPGGRLVYSTCTLLPRENGEMVEGFLMSHPDFTLLDGEKELPLLSKCDKMAKSYITLFPQQGGRDGFFVAVLEKNK